MKARRRLNRPSRWASEDQEPDIMPPSYSCKSLHEAARVAADPGTLKHSRCVVDDNAHSRCPLGYLIPL